MKENRYKEKEKRKRLMVKTEENADDLQHEMKGEQQRKRMQDKRFQRSEEGRGGGEQVRRGM